MNFWKDPFFVQHFSSFKWILQISDHHHETIVTTIFWFDLFLFWRAIFPFVRYNFNGGFTHVNSEKRSFPNLKNSIKCMKRIIRKYLKNNFNSKVKRTPCWNLKRQKISTSLPTIEENRDKLPKSKIMFPLIKVALFRRSTFHLSSKN